MNSDKLLDLVVDGKQPSVDDVKEHFAETIFWNWQDSVGVALDDPQRIEMAYPLSVGDVYCSPEDEDQHHDKSLTFECGECTVGVGVIHVTDRDESARPQDAEFIANLPVYVPVLFREIAKLTKQRDDLLAAAVTMSDSDWALFRMDVRPDDDSVNNISVKQWRQIRKAIQDTTP